MSTESTAQTLGMVMALITAVSCVAYERLVKSAPYPSVLFFVWFQYFWIWALLAAFGKEKAFPTLIYCSNNKGIISILIASGITSPLFYWITKKYSVLVAGTLELKYIIFLGLLSVLAGSHKPSVYTLIAVVFAILSVYFISK